MEKSSKSAVGVMYNILIAEGDNITRIDFKIPGESCQPPFPPGVYWESPDGAFSIKAWLSGYLKSQ